MCTLQKAWDSSDSLNGYKNLYSIYNSNDQWRFLTRWNAITVGKGRGSEGEKGQFLAISFFWIEVFFKGQMNQKIEIFSFVALPSPNTKKNHPKPVKEDKRSKSEHFRRLHENVSEMAA